jgi:hypothetical protein
MDALDNGHTKKVERVVGEGTNKKRIMIEDTNSNQLVFKAIAYQRFKGWNNPFWGNPDLAANTMAAELELQWYHEAMENFIRQVLNHDSNLEADVISKVQAQLVSWGKENLTEWDKMDTQARAKAFVNTFGNKITVMRDSLGSLWKGATRLTKAGAASLAQAPFMQNWDRVRRLAAQVASIGGMSGAFCLTVLVGSIWQLQGNDGAPPESQKTGLLMTGLIASITQLAGFGLEFTDVLLYYRITGAESLLDRMVQHTINVQLEKVTANLGASNLQLVESLNAERFIVRQIRQVEQDLVTELARRDIHAPRNQLSEFIVRPAERQISELLDVQAALEHNKQRQKLLTVDMVAEKEALLTEQSTLTLKLNFKRVECEKAISDADSLTKKIGWGKTALQIFGYVLSVATAIFLTWQLAKDWKELGKGQPLKWLTLLQVALALIEGVLLAIILAVSTR